MVQKDANLVDFEKKTMLKNTSLLAIVAVHTAENEPSEVGMIRNDRHLHHDASKLPASNSKGAELLDRPRGRRALCAPRASRRSAAAASLLMLLHAHQLQTARSRLYGQLR